MNKRQAKRVALVYSAQILQTMMDCGLQALEDLSPEDFARVEDAVDDLIDELVRRGTVAESEHTVTLAGILKAAGVQDNGGLDEPQ